MNSINEKCKKEQLTMNEITEKMKEKVIHCWEAKGKWEQNEIVFD